MKYEIYSGAGNDFVMINNFADTVPFERQKQTVKKICIEIFPEIDGVIFAEIPRNEGAELRMNYYNRDGSFGAMCGNGARCIAMYAYKNNLIKEREFILEAVHDFYSAVIIDNDNVKITFPKPKEVKTDLLINADFGDGLKELVVNYVNIGSDHIVILLNDERNLHTLGKIKLENLDVNYIGRILCYHNEFHPKGANVNFLQPVSNNEILLRTYERGVERETLACGTGIISSALVSTLKGITGTPVKVKVQSGEWLEVDFDIKNNNILNLSLTGSARKISEGEFEADDIF